MVIIAAVDRSEKARTVIKQASRLAEAFDDTVHVVHVLPYSEFIELGRTSAESREGISTAQVKETAAEVAAEAASDLTVAHEAVGLVGSPADSIVDYADEQEAQYIVVGPRKRSPTGKAVFGSVSQSILLNANSPVLTTIKQDTG